MNKISYLNSDEIQRCNEKIGLYVIANIVSEHSIINFLKIKI